MNADNPLASVLTATIRELTDARREILAVKLVSACQRDYTAWLQREVCRARKWTVPDVIKGWLDELDRREHYRTELASSCKLPSEHVTTPSTTRERRAA